MLSFFSVNSVDFVVTNKIRATISSTCRGKFDAIFRFVRRPFIAHTLELSVFLSTTLHSTLQLHTVDEEMFVIRAETFVLELFIDKNLPVPFVYDSRSNERTYSFFVGMKR